MRERERGQHKQPEGNRDDGKQIVFANVEKLMQRQNERQIAVTEICFKTFNFNDGFY